MDPNHETYDFTIWDDSLNSDSSLYEGTDDSFAVVPDQLSPVHYPREPGPLDVLLFDRLAEERASLEVPTDFTREYPDDHMKDLMNERIHLHRVLESIETLRQMTPNCPPELTSAETLEIIVKYMESLRLETQKLDMCIQAVYAAQMAYNTQMPLLEPYIPWNMEQNYYPVGVGPTPPSPNEIPLVPQMGEASDTQLHPPVSYQEEYDDNFQSNTP